MAWFGTRRLVYALLIVGIAASSAPAGAVPTPSAALSAQDQADLHRLETYLDGVKTLKAQFEQTNQDGSLADGTVYLSRPGRMRFEYAPPAQILIVSNGDYVAVDDLDLKQVQFYPVDATPVWFLLRESIKLSGDVTVSRVERGPKTLRVTCVQTKDANAGSITLVFSDDPLSLRQWTVVDAQGHSTSVALVDPELGGTFDPALFKLPSNPDQAKHPARER